MDHLQVGPITVTFHRTVRVKEGQISDLPPSLGRMHYYSVKEFKPTCPESWDENGIFIPLHEREALWLDFQNHSIPVAVLVGAGGINAISGEKLGLTLEKENYLTVPPQPWLDGWKGEDGTVYQFVATEYKKGEGLTVAEQLVGKESKTGGIGLAVFEANNPRELERHSRPEQEAYLCGAGGGPIAFSAMPCSADTVDFDFDCCSENAGLESVQHTNKGPTRSARKKAAEMGVGKGGKIFQKVYPDPYGGVETWKSEPSAAVAVYLVNAEQFTEITGMPMPPLPASAKEYMGTWYGLKDDELEDVSDSDKFTGLKTVFNQDGPVGLKN